LVRAGGGASFLEAGRSLLLQAFVQESLQAHGVNTDGKAFTQGGLGARFDSTWGFTAAVEAVAGSTIAIEEPLLDRTVRTTRIGLAGNARRIVSSGAWLAVFASIARDTQHIVYRATQTTFDTSSPADFTVGLSLGLPLWWKQ
jgi:hypothetical protein